MRSPTARSSDVLAKFVTLTALEGEEDAEGTVLALIEMDERDAP